MVLQSLRTRLQGRFGVSAPGAALEAQLRKATRGASIEVPEDALWAIVQASHDADERRHIMLHLHGCLGASASSQWRRLYAGFMIIEALLDRGSPDIISEVADGVHCDLVQRLSFLEAYENSFDLRVQDMIRRKAQAVRADWIARQLALAQVGADGNVDTDESGDEQAMRREPPKAAGSKAVGLLDDSTTDGESTGPPDRSPRLSSDSPNGERSRSHQAAGSGGASAATCLDLLGDEPGPPPAQAAAAVAAAPAAAHLDLLGEKEAGPPPAPAPSARMGVLVGEAPAAHIAPTAPASAAPAWAAPAPAAPTPAPAGVDWLRVAEAHGLYAPSGPGAGDMPAAVGPAPNGKTDALLDM